MRMPAFLALVPCLLVAGVAGRAQDQTLSPYFFIPGGDAALDQLPLKATKVVAEVAGVIAEVRVRQVYRNEGKRALEAVYVFPGSTRAAVHAMTMRVGERTIEAHIAEKAQARQGYQQARQEGRTATLLEQERPNVFQMSVANILPGDEVTVEFAYTELLVPSEGTYAFVFPTVVGPRYAGVPGTPSGTGETWVANPHTPAGEAPRATFDLNLRLRAGMPIARTACDSHRTRLAYAGQDALTLSLDPTETQGGNRDFIFKYQLAGGQVQSGLLLHRGKDENFFLLMAQPPARVAPADLPPREYVFIMDVSGSQNGFPLEISKRLMADLIQGLRPQDRFNVMVFEGSSAFWSPGGSKPATGEHVAQALAFVGMQSGGGGTELASAMTRALALPRTEGLSRSFVVCTDGFISADGRIFDLIRKHLGDANLFAFGIGTSVNRHLIEGMAHAGQGEAFVATRPEEASALAKRFRDYVSSPVLTQVRLRASGFDLYDVEPLGLPDVLAQRPVIAYGKWRGEATGTLTLSGVGGAGPWNQHFQVADVPADSGNAALRQLWARKRIELLGDYTRFGQSAEQIRAITDLGLRYSLLTEYTSFLAVDSEVRQAGGEATKVVQPLPMPQGVSNLAVGQIRGGSSQTVAYTIAGPTHAGTTVEVVASAGSGDSSVCCASDVMEEGMSVLETGPVVALAGSLQADRSGLDLGGLTHRLMARLNVLARQGALKGLPRALTLALLVDGSGRIKALASDHAVGEVLRPLEAGLVGWIIPDWSETRTTALRLPVVVTP